MEEHVFGLASGLLLLSAHLIGLHFDKKQTEKVALYDGT